MSLRAWVPEDSPFWRRAGRTILRRRTGPDAVYAIAYAENYDQWSYAVPHETLSAGFNTIITRWSMGEN